MAKKPESVKEHQEKELPSAAFCQYFIPHNPSDPGATEVLGQVNDLVAQWTTQGYGVATAFPLGPVTLSVGGSIKGSTVCVLFTKQ